MSRPAVPAEIERAVLVEAGHRCAIPTCRNTTTEIAHIKPWASEKDHKFENLIALCPTCHSRFDQKKEIDRKAMRMYKKNLGILNNRYGDVERRLFEYFAANPDERLIMLGYAGDILVANAVKDGLLVARPGGGTMTLGIGTPFEKAFKTHFVFVLTDAGAEFVKKFAAGENIT